MFIYNVTLNVNNTIREEWIHWMKEKHIPDMLRTGIFTQANFCRVLVDEESGGTTYAVQYFCKNREALQAYYKEYSQTLRQEGIDKFGDGVVAFRTELEVLSEHINFPDPATSGLFVYGTLMDKKVQEMILNRVPEQHPDKLIGYVREDMKIAGLYPDLLFTGNTTDEVEGLVLLLNKHELPLTDHYEGSAYKRLPVELQSGEKAWIYVGINSQIT